MTEMKSSETYKVSFKFWPKKMKGVVVIEMTIVWMRIPNPI